MRWSYLVFLLLLISSASAQSIISGVQTFTNGLTTEELFYINSTSKIRYLEVPRYLSIGFLSLDVDSTLSIYDDIRGKNLNFVNITTTKSNTDIPNYLLKWVNSTSTAQNFTTLGSHFTAGMKYNVTFNQSMAMSATQIRYSVAGATVGTNDINLSIYNHSDATWEVIDVFRVPTFGCYIRWVNISGDYGGDNTLTMNVTARVRGGSSASLGCDGFTTPANTFSFINYTFNYSTAPSPFTLYIGDNNTQFTADSLTAKNNVSINVSALDDISNTCDCINCNSTGSLCYVPFTFFSGNMQPLNYSNITANYTVNINLIDEKEGGFFNVSNITGARVYDDKNHTYIDFKQIGNKSNINFTVYRDLLRFEFLYADDQIINRYVNISISNTTGPLRVCVNKENTEHIDQIIVSTEPEPVILLSVFADCVVAQDYTRFALQNSYFILAWTIQTQYNLITYDQGVETILANIDGAVRSTIDISTLKLNRERFDFTILTDDLKIAVSGTNQSTLYYRNLADDNTNLNLTIERLDTGDVILSQTQFSNLNEFTVVLDFSTYTNVTPETVFRATLGVSDAEGSRTLKRYFTYTGNTGVTSTGFALIISIMLTFFGLTFVSTRTTFSWFGMMTSLAAMVTLTIGISTWYTLLLQAVNAIIFLYIAIIMFQKNVSTVAG